MSRRQQEQFEDISTDYFGSSLEETSSVSSSEVLFPPVAGRSPRVTVTAGLTPFARGLGFRSASGPYQSILERIPRNSATHWTEESQASRRYPPPLRLQQQQQQQQEEQRPLIPNTSEEVNDNVSLESGSSAAGPNVKELISNASTSLKAAASSTLNFLSHIVPSDGLSEETVEELEATTPVQVMSFLGVPPTIRQGIYHEACGEAAVVAEMIIGYHVLGDMWNWVWKENDMLMLRAEKPDEVRLPEQNAATIPENNPQVLIDMESERSLAPPLSNRSRRSTVGRPKSEANLLTLKSPVMSFRTDVNNNSMRDSSTSTFSSDREEGSMFPVANKSALSMVDYPVKKDVNNNNKLQVFHPAAAAEVCGPELEMASTFAPPRVPRTPTIWTSTNNIIENVAPIGEGIKTKTFGVEQFAFGMLVGDTLDLDSYTGSGIGGLDEKVFLKTPSADYTPTPPSVPKTGYKDSETQNFGAALQDSFQQTDTVPVHEVFTCRSSLRMVDVSAQGSSLTEMTPDYLRSRSPMNFRRRSRLPRPARNTSGSPDSRDRSRSRSRSKSKSRQDLRTKSSITSILFYSPLETDSSLTIMLKEHSCGDKRASSASSSSSSEHYSVAPTMGSATTNITVTTTLDHNNNNTPTTSSPVNRNNANNGRRLASSTTAASSATADNNNNEDNNNGNSGGRFRGRAYSSYQAIYRKNAQKRAAQSKRR